MRDALRKALEATLAENPNDLATHMAYADHLAEQGDPRGEFIQVQLALESPSLASAERKQLQQRERQLLVTHQAEWIGEAAPSFLTEAIPEEYRNTARFVRGWIDTLELWNIDQSIAEALGRCPTLALLRQLNIRHATLRPAGFAAIATWSGLRNVHTCCLGDEERWQVSGEGALTLIAALPRVEELGVYAGPFDIAGLFALALPNLRSLKVNHLTEYPLGVLANNASLTNLLALSCWPHALHPGEEEAYIRPEGFRAVIGSPHLRSLTHLALYLTDIGDAEMSALVASGKLRQLRVLDLWCGRITDAGAITLAACPDLRRLERLRLAQNQLTPVGIAALEATGVNLEAEPQFTAYQIGAFEHLWQGDCE